MKQEYPFNLEKLRAIAKPRTMKQTLEQRKCIWNIPESERHCEFCTANCIQVPTISTTTAQTLEQERDRYFETMEVQEYENIFESTFQKIAEHFYQFGKKQDELTWEDIELIDHAMLTIDCKEGYDGTESYYKKVLEEYHKLKQTIELLKKNAGKLLRNRKNK